MTPAPTDAVAASDPLLRDALAAYRAGKFGDAEALCKQILQQQPDHVAGLQILAAAAGQSGAPRRGIELIEHVIALQPRMADGQVQLAKLLRQDHRPSEAIAALEKAIALEPDNAAAYNDLGLIHLVGGDATEALRCFDRAVDVNPDLAIAHYNKGLALERRGSRDEAAVAFRQAAAVTPDFAEAHAKLGNLLLNSDDRAAAFDCFRRAASAKPQSGLALMCQAKILMEEENAVAAEQPARRAVERDPQNSDAHCLLGTILMELGRFGDAAAAFDLGIALNRRQISAYHQLVQVKKLTEADRPLVAQLEWMCEKEALAEEERADLCFALGKAYDDLGDYQRAIERFDEANRLKRPANASQFAERHGAAAVERLKTTFTGDFFTKNRPLGCDWEVPVLIVGMPRSGTTLVEQILSSHPEAAAGGELSFWGDRAPSVRMDTAGRIEPAWAHRTAADYRSLLEAISPTARRVTDKRPPNFNFIALIHMLFLRARIIHCRRHPVDTCLSIYFQNFSRTIYFAYDREDIAAYYRQYERLMGHWRSLLPAQCLLEIHYEELVANREAVTRRLIEFCGLEWDDACLYPERNQRSVRTASLWQARQPVYQASVARWRHYEPWLGPLRELLSDADQRTSRLLERSLGAILAAGANRNC